MPFVFLVMFSGCLHTVTGSVFRVKQETGMSKIGVLQDKFHQNDPEIIIVIIGQYVVLLVVFSSCEIRVSHLTKM